jgi:hypothetical protein
MEMRTLDMTENERINKEKKKTLGQTYGGVSLTLSK